MWQFLTECAKPGYPGVYAKVTHVLGWIHNYVKASDASCGSRPVPIPEITSSTPKGTTTSAFFATSGVEISVSTKHESFSTEKISTSSHSGGTQLKSLHHVFASFFVISLVTYL